MNHQKEGRECKVSVFRVVKNSDYTVMSNHHLRNRKISLKAKGLLSQMLSLPDEWDYTLRGLTQINREKIDAIREAIKELERSGHIVRTRKRDNEGKLRGTEYIIYEHPVADLPALENPTLDKPILENPTQLNKEKSSKEKIITDLSSTHSIPFSSDYPDTKAVEANGKEMMDTYEQIIKENIEYDILIERIDKTRLDELVTLMVETVCTNRKTIRVARDDFPVEVVRSKLLKLDSSHIEFVFDCLSKNTTEIRNIKQYLLTTLFNAPGTIDNYYSAAVNHDLYGSAKPP